MTTQMIDCKRISIPPKNREKIDDEELKSLSLTMATHGMAEAIIVRPIGYNPTPAEKGKLDLVAGERRVRAALLLGWKEIEAKIEEMDDQKAGELRLIENDQRVPYTVWEEAEHVCSLDPNLSVEETAKRLGRDPRWVARLKAVARLIEPLKAFVKAQDWPASHLPLLARFPAEQQPAILEAILDAQKTHWADFDENDPGGKVVPIVPTFRELESFLEEYQQLLSAAPWKLDDAELLPSAGPCTLCPKRSQAQTLLFPELADKKSDRCLDESCWHAKQGAFVQLNVEKLKAKGSEPILIKGYDVVPKEITEALGDASERIVNTSGLQECKKNTPGAKAAVIVSGADAGKVKYVKPYEGSTYSTSNGNGKHVNQETGEKEPPTTKERQQALKLKRLCLACEKWSDKLPELKPVFKGCVDALLIHFGTSSNYAYRDEGRWDEFAKHKFQLNKDGWEALWPVFQDRLKRNGPVEQGAGLWVEAMAQAKALGLKDVLETCWKDAVEECPLTKVLQEAKVKNETGVPS